MMSGEQLKPCHPMQPLEKDAGGVVRFKMNPIIRFLLDAGPFDMNSLAMMPWSDEDREQLAQLIGYSVSGFGELSYASDDVYDAATIEAAAFFPSEQERRDEQ